MLKGSSCSVFLEVSVAGFVSNPRLDIGSDHIDINGDGEGFGIIGNAYPSAINFNSDTLYGS